MIFKNVCQSWAPRPYFRHPDTVSGLIIRSEEHLKASPNFKREESDLQEQSVLCLSHQFALATFSRLLTRKKVLESYFLLEWKLTFLVSFLGPPNMSWLWLLVLCTSTASSIWEFQRGFFWQIFMNWTGCYYTHFTDGETAGQNVWLFPRKQSISVIETGIKFKSLAF